MAAFLGGVLGRRGEVTRLGSQRSGLHVRAQDWHHQFNATLYVGADGTTHVQIIVRTLPEGATRTVYEGPLSALVHVRLTSAT
jgi:hypothetical protein